MFYEKSEKKSENRSDSHIFIYECACGKVNTVKNYLVSSILSKMYENHISPQNIPENSPLDSLNDGHALAFETETIQQFKAF